VAMACMSSGLMKPPFSGSRKAVIYCLAGTEGWENRSLGCPTKILMQDGGVAEFVVVAPKDSRFTIGEGVDGTNCVTDNRTGLMWARNGSLSKPITKPEAFDFCEKLECGGYSDWRLPTTEELESLIRTTANIVPGKQKDSGIESLSEININGRGVFPENRPFTGVSRLGPYWSCDSDYGVGMASNQGRYSLGGGNRAPVNDVWPVRGSFRSSEGN